jgi:integrase
MIYQRRGIYHCDFTVNGQRVRQTLETTDRREAIQRERDLIARAREGKLACGRTAEFSRLLFGPALDRYLAELSVQRAGNGESHVDPRRTWEGYLTNRLRPFFAGKRLHQITADDVRAYQAKRLGQAKNPNTINHEVKALMRVLKRAKLLSRIRDDIKLLPVRREPRQMLTQAEKQRLFETAAMKPEWQTAYCAALLTANTSMRPVEIKRLKWQDLDPVNRLLTVRRSKTEAGTRTIPLNEEAWSAIAAMKERADALGTYAPEHYIFHRLWPKIEPGRPMSNWRSAWRSLRKAAGMPRLRFYNLRHQCITEMLEAGVPEGVIREIAGHVDPEMTRLYSHPRMAAKRVAVEALSRATQSPIQGEIEAGCVTKSVTKQLPASVGTA